MSAPRRPSWRSRALVASLMLLAPAAQAFAPLELGPPRVRRSDDALRATGVAVANEQIEGWAARCATAQRDATRVATNALHGYVDDIVKGASPEATARAHDAVEAGTSRTASRTLVDCAASVEVTLPLVRLREATSAWSIAW